MVKQVMLIGFIGLLIALSNASEEESKIENDAKNFKKAISPNTNFPHKVGVASVNEVYSCPKDFPVVCASLEVAGCAADNVIKGLDATKFVDVNLVAKAEAKKYFDSEIQVNTVKCKKLSGENLIETKVYDGLVHTLEGFNVKEAPNTTDKPVKTNPYCEAYLLKDGKKVENSSVYYIENPPSEAAKNPTDDQKKDAEKAKEDFEKAKKTLAVFKSKTKVELLGNNGKETYNIQCYGVSSSNMMWWIIASIVVVVLVGGVAYWYFFYGDDEDDEGTCRGPNSAGNNP